jgi:hypothetical protein
MEHEIVAPGPLLGPTGALAEPGFSRRPLLRYNPERIGLTPLRCLNRLRLKEWDFYATTTREVSFSVAVAHGGVAGVVAAQLIDFRTRTLLERSAVTPLGRGCALPRSSEAGDVSFRRRGIEVDFLAREERREIRVRWPRFEGERALEVHLVAAEPRSLESMTIATPIGARGFYFNRKVTGMATEGAVAAGELRFDLAGKGARTTLDWGRGVWPYRTFWIWANGAGVLADGRAFGLNLGAGFGDLRAATENCFFVDGRMTKLGGVEFDYDRADPARGPWRFRAAGGRLDLELPPSLFVMRKRVDALLIRSDLAQITGEYRGFAITDAGERIEVSGIIGWAEEHRARW